MTGHTASIFSMHNRALAAEAFGTFMLMSAIFGSVFYSFGAPSGAAGILGVAFCIGITVMVTAFAIGHVSGGHTSPTFAANGYGELSMLKASLFEVFVLETVLTAFFLIVIMGVTRANGPSLMAPVAFGLA